MTPLIFVLGLLLGPQQIAAKQAPQAHRIAGIVVDAVTGAPVIRAEVSISGGEEHEETATREDGRFILEGLEGGKKYSLSATAPGYVRESYNQHWAYATSIAVGVGIDSEHLVFHLHPQAVIYGVVTDESGEPVRKAEILLFGIQPTNGRRIPSMRGSTQTNDLGTYRFAHLSAGKYFIAVNARPWYAETILKYSVAASQESHSAASNANSVLDMVYPVTFYPGVTDEHSAGELNMRAGEKEEADIQLSAVPSVHMRVTGPPGDENASFSIRATQKLFGSFAVNLNAAQSQIVPGEYELGGLPPGQMTLTLNQTSDKGSSTRTIAASVGAEDTLDAADAPTDANVSGRVISPTGGTPSVQAVMFEGQGDQIFFAQLQKDGTFSLPPVGMGTYKIFVRSNDAEYVQRISAVGAKTSGHELTIETPGDVQLTVNVSQGLGQVKGVVRVDGNPAAGVMVLIAPESGENLEEHMRMDQSDSDGTFTLPGIVPGKYLLMAIQDGWNLEWANWSVLQPYREKAQALQIAPNQTETVTVDAQRVINPN